MGYKRAFSDAALMRPSSRIAIIGGRVYVRRIIADTKATSDAAINITSKGYLSEIYYRVRLRRYYKHPKNHLGRK
jgi:hypothetical protein